MSKFEVRGGKLLYGGKPMGPDTALYADSLEKCKGAGVVGDRNNPERVDYIFVAGGKVVCVESKTVDDLASSWMSGRLQRQLRTMLELTQDVGYAAILIRGAEDWHDLDELRELRVDLLKWQMMGGLILFGPKGSPLQTLADAKECLSGVRNVRTAIARYEKQVLDGTPEERALQAMFRQVKGKVGPVLAKKLLARFGSVVGVLTASDTELRAAGATKATLSARKVLVK